jgi:uncharacterized protein (TIGR03083 family)
MEIAEHIDALRRQGEQMADAAERAGLDAPVPPCSPWLVKDLLRHTGYVHRWAAQHITDRPGQILDGPSEEEMLAGGAADAELLAWFRAGHAALAQTLATADPALDCATFMAAPSPLAFWARRQAHETAIHRADAESASGATPDYEPAFAADGIDELIMGFGRRRKYAPAAGPDPKTADGAQLHLLTADTGDAWLVEAHEGRLQPRRVTVPDTGDAEDAGCMLTGPASGVYLYLWNRVGAAPAGVTVTGDPGVLSAWQASVRVRWS